MNKPSSKPRLTRRRYHYGVQDGDHDGPHTLTCVRQRRQPPIVFWAASDQHPMHLVKDGNPVRLAWFEMGGPPYAPWIEWKEAASPHESCYMDLPGYPRSHKRPS